MRDHRGVTLLLLFVWGVMAWHIMYTGNYAQAAALGVHGLIAARLIGTFRDADKRKNK